jgi:hypothetical protein
MKKLEHKVGEVIEIAGKKYIVKECDDTKGCIPCDLFGKCSKKPYSMQAGRCAENTRMDGRGIIYKEYRP